MLGGLVRTIAVFFLGGLSWSLPGWAADCPAPNTPEQIAERLTAAQSALSQLDSEQFSFSMEEVGLMVPCLSARPEPSGAADLHRMLGVHLYTAGKTQAATDALRAAKVLVPDYQFPTEMFPEGYALLDTWKGLSPGEPSHVRAPVPKNSDVAFDGRLTRDRPSDRVTLFQHLSRDGAVLKSVMLQPDHTIPTYESVPRQRNRIIGATIAMGISAGITYGLSWHGHRKFERNDASLSRAELQSLRKRVNNSFGVSGALTALTATGVVAAILVGPR